MNTKHVVVTLLFLLLNVFSFSVQAQAKVDNEFEISFIDDNGIPHPAVRAKKTISAFGNIIISASFQLPENHELVPPKGWWPRIIEVQFETISKDGTLVFISDEKVDIPSNGKFNVSLHMNGSGNSLPWGWYTPNDE
jgi:hypothetical protein